MVRHFVDWNSTTHRDEYKGKTMHVRRLSTEFETSLESQHVCVCVAFVFVPLCSAVPLDKNALVLFSQ